MVRKWLAFTVAIFVIAFLQLAETASANSPSFSLTASNAQPAVNEEIQVIVSGNGLTDIFAYEFNVYFDPAKLEFKGNSGTTTIPGMSVPAKLFQGSEAFVRFAHTQMGDDPGISGSATLVTLTFIKKDAGPAELSLKSLKLCNSDLQETVLTSDAKLVLHERVDDSAPVVKINVQDFVLIGTDVTVGIGLSNLPVGVNAEHIKIQFEDSLFDFISAKAANDKSTIIGEPLIHDGHITLLLANLNGPISGDHDIVNLIFKAKYAGAGNLRIDAQVGIGTDGSEVEVRSASKTVQVVVVVHEPEDLNQNGRADVGDLAIVSYYYGLSSGDAGWDQAKKADVNHDGKIDIADLSYVAYKILQY